MEYTEPLLSLFIILTTAKLFAWIATKFGQVEVLGEIIGGVIIGGSVLGLVKETHLLHFLAELGAIFLLFEIGVESHLFKLLKVGIWSFLVAVAGVAVPFVLGYYVSIFFGIDNIQAIFIGAILTATSVGITARVFSDLHKLQTREAQIVLGAAVIDDVIGLGILAVVTKLVTDGAVSFSSIAFIAEISVAFIVVSLLVGISIAPVTFRMLKKREFRGLIIVSAVSICLLLSYLSARAGLAPIVGAFAAGLILSITESKTHIEEQTRPISDVFVPIFFVLMGTLVDISILNPFNPANHTVLLIAAGLFVVAVAGKAVSGYAVLEKKVNHLLIGAGMIPRGEVGLIFAGLGITRKIITPSIYSAAVVVIMLTTFITPFLLKSLCKEKCIYGKEHS